MSDRSTVMEPAALAELSWDPRRAISEEGIVCLECGRVLRHQTNTHLDQHGLTSDEYKLRFGYNGRRALMAPSVRRAHATNAVRLGLADLIRERPIVANPSLGGAAARANGRLKSRCDAVRAAGINGRRRRETRAADTYRPSR